jgi:hypothetical protein
MPMAMGRSSIQKALAGKNTTASLAMDHNHRWNGGLMMTAQTAKPFGRGKAMSKESMVITIRKCEKRGDREHHT